MTSWPRLVLALGATLLGTAAVAQGVSCEQLRVDIESRVRAKGVRGAVVTVVDASVTAPGQRVGNCDGGRKKLLLTRDDAAPLAAAPPMPPAPQTAPAPPKPPVITECADGRVITSGSCKR